MDAVESLPPRPLTEAELALLNRADSVTLAVAVAERDPVDEHDEPDERERTEASDDTEFENDGERSDGVLVATESEVVGLALVNGTWTIVDRVAYGDGVKRYDALQSCESAVRHALE